MPTNNQQWKYVEDSSDDEDRMAYTAIPLNQSLDELDKCLLEYYFRLAWHAVENDDIIKCHIANCPNRDQELSKLFQHYISLQLGVPEAAISDNFSPERMLKFKSMTSISQVFIEAKKMISKYEQLAIQALQSHGLHVEARKGSSGRPKPGIPTAAIVEEETIRQRRAAIQAHAILQWFYHRSFHTPDTDKRDAAIEAFTWGSLCAYLKFLNLKDHRKHLALRPRTFIPTIEHREIEFAPSAERSSAGAPEGRLEGLLTSSNRDLREKESASWPYYRNDTGGYERIVRDTAWPPNVQTTPKRDIWYKQNGVVRKRKETNGEWHKRVDETAYSYCGMYGTVAEASSSRRRRR